MPKSPLTQPSWRDRGTCWATTKAGLPCGRPACSKPESSGIPYCARHMRVGDEAFQVVEHDEHPEIFGKILIARHPIPKNYRLVYWGALRRGSDVKIGDAGEDHMIDFCPNPYSDQSRGTIDPTRHKGAIAQFAATNGPGELISMTPEYELYDYGKKRTACAGCTYRFVRNIPKGCRSPTTTAAAGWRSEESKDCVWAPNVTQLFAAAKVVMRKRSRPLALGWRWRKRKHSRRRGTKETREGTAEESAGQGGEFGAKKKRRASASRKP